MNSTLPIAPKKSLEDNFLNPKQTKETTLPAGAQIISKSPGGQIDSTTIQVRDDQFNKTVNLTGSYINESFNK